MCLFLPQAIKATLDTYTKMAADKRRNAKGLGGSIISLVESQVCKGVESAFFYCVQIIFSVLVITAFIHDGKGHLTTDVCGSQDRLLVRSPKRDPTISHPVSYIPELGPGLSAV
jgi:hypothetical protein